MDRRKFICGSTTALTMNSFAEKNEKPLINSKLKRVIFFLQNQGFHPDTCIPKKITKSCSLEEFKLEEPMKDLEPYKDKMHIITGLHGRHATPTHRAKKSLVIRKKSSL